MKQINWTRAFFGLLVVAWLVTFAAAYIAFFFARMFYANENAVRLSPLGLSAYTDIPTRTAPDIQRVVFVGDSRAYSWPAPVNAAGWEFINRGIDGQTTAQILGRFSAHIVPLQPQVIVLQLGINDLRTVPIFPASRAVIMADCLDNIQVILRQAQDLGATVILTTVFPVTEPSLERRIFFWSDDITRAVNEVNIKLRGLASERVIVLDADAILLGANGLARPDYMEDALHLNPAGYAALNQRLVQLLASLS